MTSEGTPLLAPSPDPAVLDHELVYQRFSPARKRFILALVSLAGIMPLFVSGTFVPSIPQIAEDLHSTGSIISLAISLSVLTNCVGGLLWSKYSGFYGRRPIYLLSTAFLCLGSFGVANVASVPQLLCCRVFQAFGSSSALSIAMGVIGDIYKLEERGTASGTYFGFVLLGPAIAPLAGGIATHYYSWRAMQGSICAFALFLIILFTFFLPETSHPGARGIDKLLEKGEKPGFVVLNPFSSLWLLRSPNILLVAIAGGFALLTDYVLMVPIAYTIGRKYGITNEALIGAFFVPNGFGNLLGAYIAGRLSDKEVVKWRKRRGGFWVPEDRLRTTLIGALVWVPLSTLISGLATDNVDGTPGIVINLVCLFVNGVGLDFVLAPSAGYNVDVLHAQSAEVTAANMALRGTIISLASALALPSIERIGVTGTDAIAAGLGWTSFVLLWSVIKYGDRMRAFVDVGFSTAQTN